MKHSILIIVPYFGRFPNYFQLWLQSCKFNPTIDWLLVTDDKSSYHFPSNVKVEYTTFTDFKKEVQNNFDFEIQLPNAYLLCEFRMAYGEIFRRQVQGYDFWGFCDNDVVFGNLRAHITPKVLDAYSKISWRGHLTLIRNNERLNSLYKTPYKGVEFYKYALGNRTLHPLASDERFINLIFEQQGETIYKGMPFADLKIRSFNFELLHFPDTEAYKNQHQVFEWCQGNLYRVYVHEDKIVKEQFAYIHFLKRSMDVCVDQNADHYYIVPNKFIPDPPSADVEWIKRVSRQRFYTRYFFSRLSFKFFRNKRKYFENKKLFAKLYPFMPTEGFRVILDPVKPY